jgi:hypothetical protein
MNSFKGFADDKASPFFSFFMINYSHVRTPQNRNNTEKRDLQEIKMDSCFENTDCVLDSG